ncbi:MAG: integrase arm-type DNA-binding domain-containing protein [Proteobacteria bacterium]|nr:integrase arm-type DNA-binding domain-containing protein [Pseudomonadota bacterium]
MVSVSRRLKQSDIQKLPPGMHADGGNLYLAVQKSGSRQWVMIYQYERRRREIGLGGAGPNGMPLAEARTEAESVRAILRQGLDPKAVRSAAVNDVMARGVPTFGDFADEYIEQHRTGWKNEKHAAQWVMTMREYAAPIRDKPVNEIVTADLEAILAPIWATKNETATRVRGRIEAILDAARVKGHIDERFANPARFEGHLKLILPKVGKLQRGHHKALPYSKLPEFMSRLRQDRAGNGSRALEFTILTCVRTSNTLLAEWSEFQADHSDPDDLVWTIPARKMKTGKDFAVPIVGRAAAIIKILRKHQDEASPYVFRGTRRRQPISNGTMERVLDRMKVDVTVHGFRSTFRDWAGDLQDAPAEIAEAVLAHTYGGKTEQAYRRLDAFEKRRALMIAWDDFCWGSPFALEPDEA